MRRVVFLTFMTMLIVAAVFAKTRRNEPSVPSSPIPEPTLDERLTSVTEQSCLEKLEYLASDELEGRMSGKKGNVLAAEFIKKFLSDCGLEPVTQRFRIKRLNPGPKDESGDDFTENVYAQIRGGEIPDEVVVMGAHFDHIGYGPRYSRSGRVEIHNGADDNASGTVAVMEAAKAMSGLKPKRTIVFQFYSAEEMGLLGSRHYCENPIFPEESPDISKHVAMINLDMVGHLNASQYKVSVPDSALDIRGKIMDLGERYPFARNITGRGSGGSDHASFYNKKVPVAFIHTGSHRHYHTPSDDVDTLDVAGVAEVSRYAAELVWRLANDKNAPDFDESKFKEMPYTHDHGIGEF